MSSDQPEREKTMNELIVEVCQGQNNLMRSSSDAMLGICRCLEVTAKQAYRLGLEVRAMKELLDVDQDALDAKIEELKAEDEAYAAEKALLADSLADDPEA